MSVKNPKIEELDEEKLLESDGDRDKFDYGSWWRKLEGQNLITPEFWEEALSDLSN